MKIRGSLLSKLAKILFLFIALQLLVGGVMVVYLGIVSTHYNTAYNNINFIVLKKAEELEIALTNTSKNLERITATFNQALNKSMGKEGSAAFVLNTKAADEFFVNNATELSSFLYANPKVSGVFVVLGTEPLVPEDMANPGLYIRRRTSEDTIYSPDNYWVLKFGSQTVASTLNIQLDYLWEHHFYMPQQTPLESLDFFNKPFHEALNGNTGYYFSKPFQLAGGDQKIITNTMPLIDANGKPYGVFGIEINLDLLAKDLKVPLLPNIYNGFYSLAGNDQHDFSNAYVNSTPFASVYVSNESIRISPVDSSFNIYKYENNKAQIRNMIGTFSSIRLYNTDSPYANEQYVLYGLVSETELLKDAIMIRNFVVGIAVAFLAFSSLMTVIVSISVTRPIVRISEEVSRSDADQGVSISPIGVREIDDLVTALEVFSKKVVHSASRLSTIVNLVGRQIGCFEENVAENKVYISDSVFKMLAIPPNGKTFISFDEWFMLKDIVLCEKMPEQDDIYRFDTEDHEERYLQIVQKQERLSVYGVITDVTNEVMEKRRLEYERDVDVLTGLLNRNAFNRNVTAFLTKNPNVLGAMLFFDVDNLKYMNDNYGHSKGDELIQLMARCLESFPQGNSFLARISGDEFAVFLYGYETQDELRMQIQKTIQYGKKLYMTLPDRMQYKLRCSVGIAWYPQDSVDVSLLIRYADFAMYEIKHSNKGNEKEFSLDSYNEKSFLTTKLEILNSFLEDSLLYFSFQPIVDSRTGVIFGYEALMRSKHGELTSPKQIYQLAKSQSKLYQLERLIVFSSIKYATECRESFHEKKFFFNSILSAMFTEDDFRELSEANENNIMSNMVLEIAEIEQMPLREIELKIANFRSLGMQIAIDDFGTGHSNELTLVSVTPDYIKVDMSIVHGIDSDLAKQNRLQDLIRYASYRGIKVIAVGVETMDELQMLSAMGVDYYQGFLFYRPSPDLVMDDPSVLERIASLRDEETGALVVNKTAT